MKRSVWASGAAVPSPAYLDTNVLVSAIVRNHPLYSHAAQLFGELMAEGVELLVSTSMLQEGLWALAKISYCEMFNQKSGAQFKLSTYLKHREAIYEKYSARMYAVGVTLRDWHDAGLPMTVVPADTADYLDASDRVPLYMERYGLAPGDAVHLALAETHARVLLTADDDLAKAAEADDKSPLLVLQLTAN